MVNPIKIRMAEPSESDTVGSMVYNLIVELSSGEVSSRDREKMIEVARDLLQEDSNTWAFIALNENNECIGLLTLNECSAIYAGGFFGEITELYVSPDYRSSKIGAELIDFAIEFGRNKGWSRFEVGAPDLPRWKKTVTFYERYGFTTVGPRLKLSFST